MKDKVICQAKVGNGKYAFNTDMGNIYVSHQGYVVPCCWMGTDHQLELLWKNSNINKETHNIKHESIENILEGPMWKWIDDNINDYPLCIKKCVNKEFDAWSYKYV